MAANEIPDWYATATEIAPERTPVRFVTSGPGASASTDDIQHSADSEYSAQQPSTKSDESSVLRQVVESLACLAVAVIVFRAFLLEGYIISTGSMAPALLGYHKQVVCPDCSFEFAYGVAFDQPVMPSSQLATCPNCGQGAIDLTNVPRNDGDQLLVNKYAYLFDDPDRWEVVVFLNPNNPNQAYVKRVVGLPGETVFVRDGDVYIDGQIQQKSMAEQRAIRIPVFDQNHPATYSNWIPRWIMDPEWSNKDSVFSFAVEQSHNARLNSTSPFAQRTSGRVPAITDMSWVKYFHWPRLSPHTEEGSSVSSSSIRPGIITDYYGYNQSSRITDQYRINDLMLSTRLSFGQKTRSGDQDEDELIGTGTQGASSGRGEFVTRLSCRTSQILCRINADTKTLDLWIVGPKAEEIDQALSSHSKADFTLPLKEEFFDEELLLELSSFDRRASVAVNGVELAALPLDNEFQNVPDGMWSGRPDDDLSKVTVAAYATGSNLSAAENAPALGSRGVHRSAWATGVEARQSESTSGQAVDRDSSDERLSPVAFGSRRGSVAVRSVTLYRDVHYTTENHRHATERPLTLGDDEFFFLGDNSPVSLDSRGWDDPVVPRRLLVGRPLVVHLPSHPGRIKIGSMVKYIRVPDFSKIRCIR